MGELDQLLVADSAQILGKLKLFSSGRKGSINQRESNPVPVPESGIQPYEQTKDPDHMQNLQPKLLRREGLSLLTGPPGASDNGTIYDVDVIAIHGLNGHPRNTWTAKHAGAEVFWLQDLLPKALPGARILTYGYDSRTFFSPSTGNMAAYAKGLLDELDLERRSPESLVIANNKRNRYQWVLDSTKAIFFFGTPHHGSDFADTMFSVSPILQLFDWGLIEFVSGKGKLVRRDLIKELSAKSKPLDELCNEFVERTEKVPIIVTFHELQKIRGCIVSAQLISYT
ncbi:hypothetical protein MMC26_004346 [Xylographa opegraphella]|nr:hypothetical protein [Xylographa opegraphella]